MNVILDGEEFNVKVGEFIRTLKGDGEIIMLEPLYEKITIKRDEDDQKVTVKPSEVIGIGKPQSFLISELADKELVKDGKTKPRFSLIPQLALQEVAQVFTDNTVKYPDYNYSKGGYGIDYIDACHRHINKYLTNEDVDDESGLHHLAHAASNLLMLLDNIKNNKNIDKRNKLY